MCAHYCVPWFHSWAHITHCFQSCFFNALGTDLVFSFWVAVSRAGLCLLASWEYGKASFPLAPCSKHCSFPWAPCAYILCKTKIYTKCCESYQVGERSRVHHYMGMLRGLGVLVWLCATYFCSGSTGARYCTWHSQPEPHPAHLSKLASFDQLFFFLFISLCVPLPTVPFSLASLCLSGSIRQCSHLFFTFHLPSVLSIVSVVLDFVLSPFPLAFNVLVSDVTMHLISQAGNHQVVIDLFSSTSSWFSMKGCSCPAPYLHPHPVSPTPRPRLFQYPGYFYQFFVF